MLISLIIPTYNEKDNIADLIKEVSALYVEFDLQGEIIIVDDNSPDGTAEVVKGLSDKYPVSVVKRAGKLGLSSAVIEGFKNARGEIFGVMDADFSHDMKIIPNLVKAITDEGADMSVGSRYVKGGGVENWPLHRQIISRGAVILAMPLTPVKDITSGFFFVKKEAISGITLNPVGFKIGLEIMAKGRIKKIKEVPYIFRDRRFGVSKLSDKEIKNYLKHLKDLYYYKFFSKKK